MIPAITLSSCQHKFLYTPDTGKIYIGTCDQKTQLWSIDLQPPAQPINRQLKSSTPHTLYTNYAYTQHNLPKLVQYLHKAKLSRVPSTLFKAIKVGYFTMWSGLTPALVYEHRPKSIATAKCHMREASQGTRSPTKGKPPKAVSSIDAGEVDNKSPATPNPTSQEQRHEVFITPTEITGQLSTDQTGPFPIHPANDPNI